jgi:hypothetical protein
MCFIEGQAIQTLQTCAHICTTLACYLLPLVRANMIPVSRLSQHRGILSGILVIRMRMCALVRGWVGQALQDVNRTSTRSRHTMERSPTKQGMLTAPSTVSHSGRIQQWSTRCQRTPTQRVQSKAPRSLDRHPMCGPRMTYCHRISRRSHRLRSRIARPGDTTKRILATSRCQAHA